GSQIVGAIHIHRIDRRLIGELHQIDDTSRFRTDFLEVVLREDDVTAFFELVTFHDLRVRDFPVAVRAPSPLLDARLTLTMKLIERNGAARLGRWEDLDGNVHQADLEEALPRRACSHSSSAV